MMLVEETTIPAAALPVDQFKAHLQLGTGFADDAVQHAVLESFLRAAIAAIEARTGKILIEREFSWSVSQWRDFDGQYLPVAPVNDVTEFVIVSHDDSEMLLDLQDFYLQEDSHRPRLIPVLGQMPTIPDAGSAEIVFSAGFAGAFSDLPPDLAQSVLMLAAHYYENRNAIGMADTAIPFGVLVLIERYKTLRVLGGGAA